MNICGNFRLANGRGHSAWLGMRSGSRRSLAAILRDCHSTASLRSRKNIMLRRGWVLGCFLLGMCLSHSLGCRFSSNPSPETSNEKASGKKVPLRVIATVGMVGDLVRAMGGEQVQVRHLMAAGSIRTFIGRRAMTLWPSAMQTRSSTADYG